MDELQGLSEEADEAGEAAYGLLLALADAETGQRGYLLTTQPAYLEPCWTARQRAERTLTQLDTLAKRLGWPRPDVDTLKTYPTQKLAELEQTVSLASNGNRDAALAVVNGYVGKATMDAARDVIARVTARAADERERRMAEAKERKRVAALGTLAAATGGILLLGTATLALLLGRSRLMLARAREAAAGALAGHGGKPARRHRGVRRARSAAAVEPAPGAGFRPIGGCAAPGHGIGECRRCRVGVAAAAAVRRASGARSRGPGSPGSVSV